MKVNKLMNALLVFLILIICIGAVSASEDVSMDDAVSSIDSEPMDVSQGSESNGINDNQHSSTNDIEVLSFSDSLDDDVQGISDDESSISTETSENTLKEEETLSFKDVQSALAYGNEYNLTKDVKFNPETDDKKGIMLTKRMTINGNGHTIDGANLARIFHVWSSSGFLLTLNNLTLINGMHDYNDGASGGAISVTGNARIRIAINNVTFIDNHANQDPHVDKGGAIYINNNRAELNITDCTFENNSVKGYGGAIAVLDGDVIVSNSKFKHNYVDDDFGVGGAIYAKKITVNNCEFIDNNAGTGNGSAGAISSPNMYVYNSKFVNNSAEFGGALGDYFDNNFVKQITVANSTFEDNTAKIAGGAIKMENRGFDAFLNIENSSFVNNDGGNFAGGAILGVSTTVKNSNFTNNTVFNYAGAISSTNLDVDNCRFVNNSAKESGALFTVNFSVKDSVFEGNKANNDTIITTLAGFKHEGTELPKVKTYNNAYDTAELEFLGYLHGYDLYCMERQFIRHTMNNYVSELPSFYTDDTSYVVNYVNKIEVYEHLKILYYLCNLDENLLEGSFRTERGRELLTGTILTLTEEDLNNPQDDIIKEVMALYNSGFRVPEGSYNLPNGTLVKYNITFFLNAEDQQNYIFYQQETEDAGINVTKETLNKSVEIGQEVEFRITVTNTGNQTLKKVFVNDSDFDEGLIYKSYRNEIGNWTFNETSKIWTLTTDLAVNQSASFIVIFKTNKLGELVNNVTAGFLNFTLANSSNTTNVTNVTVNNETNETNETVPEDEEIIEDDDTPEDEDEEIIEDDDTTEEEDIPDEDVSVNKKVHVSKNATGNPLFALALMILTLIFVPKRKN